MRLDFWEVLGPGGDGINPLDFIDENSPTAADDALTAGLGVAAALALVVAALLLERVCRVSTR